MGPSPNVSSSQAALPLTSGCKRAMDVLTRAVVFMPFAHFTIGLFVFFSLISHDTLHVKNSKLCLFWLLTFSLWKLFIPTLQPSFLLIHSVGTWARGGAPDTRPYVPRTRGRLASRVSDAAGGSVTEPRRLAVRPRGWEGGKCRLISDRLPPPLAQPPSLFFCDECRRPHKKWLLLLGMVPTGLTLFSSSET